MKWIRVEEQLPELSYEESDDYDHPYESYPVLVFCPERPGIQCVAYLVQDQDEESWNYGDLSWELYVPGDGRNILEVEFSVFTHWMPLPHPPKIEEESAI